MKIGLVRRGYSRSGGAESYLRRFAAALRDAGHEPVLFASPEWESAGWNGEFIAVAGRTPRDFADRLRALHPAGRCDRLFSLERVWECDAFRAGDGVHRAWLARRRAFEAPWQAWVRSLQAKHRQLLQLEQAVFDPKADRVIVANSHMVSREITEYFGVPPEKIRVIYNGIAPRDLPGSDEKRRQTRARLGLGARDWAVLFAGSGWERKGLRFAMGGIEQVPGAVLLVAGAGKRRGLPSPAKTQFLGEVQEMEGLMEAADAFLLPTLYDPFSNASLEALAAGLPVITTQANGFSEIMRLDRDGEVLRTPREGIPEALQKWRALETPELRRDRRHRAREYTMERNVRETLAAIL